MARLKDSTMLDMEALELERELQVGFKLSPVRLTELTTAW
jgi:hypothetical protein